MNCHKQPVKEMKPKRRHIIAFLLFTFLLFGALYVVTINGDDFQVAEGFVTRNPKLLQSIGQVRRVKFRYWDGFESVDGNGGLANYSFDAVTNGGTFLIQVHLRCESGMWHVQDADIFGPDGSRVVTD
jgi:hypothetical protein